MNQITYLLFEKAFNEIKIQVKKIVEQLLNDCHKNHQFNHK